MIGKVAFIIAGIVWVFSGLFSALIVVGMFQHPGGIGAEKLLGPVIGLVALVFFSAGGLCLYVDKRLGNNVCSASLDARWFARWRDVFSPIRRRRDAFPIGCSTRKSTALG